jgi:transcriptional regulator with XRE-family HTH domain
MTIGARLKEIRLALDFTQERMATHIHDHSGKGSRASVSNWETGRAVEAGVVRVYGDLAEQLGLAPTASGAQWVLTGESIPRDTNVDQDIQDMAAIELFLRSQPDLSNRAQHQIRDFYRNVLQEEERDRRAKQIASGDDGS